MYTKDIKNLMKKMLSNLEKEKRLKSTLKSLNNPLSRLSSYTGVSERTIKRWINTRTEEKPKPVTRIKDFRNIDEFNIDLIMRTIRKMWDNQEPIFLKKLLRVLHKDHNIEISKTTLYRVMRRKGLKFKNTKGNSKRWTAESLSMSARLQTTTMLADRLDAKYETPYLVGE